MALPATDAFGGGAGALGANWTTQHGTVTKTAGGEAIGSTGGDVYNGAMWAADAFANDQYGQCTLGSHVGSGSRYVGPACRCSATGASWNQYYGAVGGSSKNDYFISKIVANSDIALSNFANAHTIGDTMKVEAVGTAVKVYKNGVQIGTTQTDSSLSSGAAGVFLFGDGQVDNFQGDTVGGGGGATAWGGHLSSGWCRIARAA